MRSVLLVLLLVLLAAIQPCHGLPFETIFADNHGLSPTSGLVKGRNGNFYGTTQFGGPTGYGTVFMLTPSGERTTLAFFDWNNGASPVAGLVEGKDGNFYGTTSDGKPGVSGTVFKITPSGELTTLIAFSGSNGANPVAGLVEGKDGNFYGTTSKGGPSGSGTVFRITSSGELTTLVTFDGSNGRAPMAGLVEDRDGNFYGTTSAGGSGGAGTVFKVTPAGQLTTLITFDGSNGRAPMAGLVEDRDGNFYGTTSAGGSGGNGTVFKVTPAGQLTTLVSFTGSNGKKPSAGLIEGSDGNFYGTTPEGGAGNVGTVFRMTSAGELTTIVSFTGGNGSTPVAGLVKGSDGNLYGTTEWGGANRYGCVFKVTPTGALTTLHSFSLSKGGYPVGGLLEGSDGNLYGVTEGGGANNLGTVFKVTPAGELTVVASFSEDGGHRSTARLVEGSDGNFYGTRVEGPGISGSGWIFKVTPAGVITRLASFTGSNGRFPYAGLVEGADGNFYGTTSAGGPGGYGTVFKVTPTGILTTLISFTFNGSNGRNPYGGLVRGRDGNFYGTTDEGGANGRGTIFKITPAGELSTLVSFDYDNGSKPYAGLVEGRDGNFYGTTTRGGEYGEGTVFKMTPSGELTTLVSLDFIHGGMPYDGVDVGSDGNLYGTTFYGGAYNEGTIFKVTPEGQFTLLHSFDTNYASHQGVPRFASDGNLYGVAQQMAIWRLSLTAAPDISTTAPGGITTTGTTLSGIVNANGADTTATFEYGLTQSYNNSIAAVPGSVTGMDATVVSAMLSGLAPHTTYYYRLVASNSRGSVSTEWANFTTANSLPIANADSASPETDNLDTITLAVLENDSDADGDPLTITAVTQGAFGTVNINGNTLRYTPGPGFYGRDTFTYTVSDGFDSATASVELRSDAPFTRVLLSQGSEVPGAGQSESGLPGGALFTSFGVPAINSAGGLAFTSNYSASGGTGGLSIFGFEPEAVKSTLAASRGQKAPGTQDALFASFKDPVINEVGDIAFLASLSGGDTTKLSNQGIWICSSSEDSGAGMLLVARAGAQVPGAPVGARWKSFTSVAFASSGGDNDSNADSRGWSLAFTGFMTAGHGGVNASNDMGLWLARPGRMLLALREGQKLVIDGTEKKLRSFASLMPLPGAPAQGNGLSNGGAVAVQAFFTDRTQAILQVSPAAAGDSVTVEALALPGDPVAGFDETAATFGIPTQSSSGAMTAWIGTLSGKRNPAAVFERKLSEPELLKLLARKGDAAPGIDGASFRSFRSVAANDSGSALLLGKVSGKGITASGDDGLWWRKGNGGLASLQLLAREGAQPPGTPEGARWSAFSSLALPEGAYGPLFTATLVTGSKGKAGPGGITSATDQGLWAVDSKGELQLVVQEGRELIVDGSGTRKTLRSFTVLSAVSGSPAQRRSFDADGRIVYRALFTDGSQAIVAVQLP